MSRGDSGRQRPRSGQGQNRSERERRVHPARQVAYDVLRAVSASDAYANLLLPTLIAETGLTPQDAGLATELTYGTLRRRGTYDAIIAEAAGRPLADIDPAVLDALRLGAHQLLATRVADHAAVNETGLPFALDDIVILWQQIGVFRLPKTGNQGVFLGNLSGPIDDARAAFNAIEAGFRIIGVTHGFRGPDQGFRGHTTDIDAGAADGAAADEGHLGALIGCRDRGREAGRAGADDDIIELIPGQGAGDRHGLTLRW